MKQSSFNLALATGIVIALSALAPAQIRGHGFGHHHHWRGSSGFGLGLGFGNRSYAPRTPAYRNAFTSDVTYAERAMNDFRASYEQRGKDVFGVKIDVQQLDQTLERLRKEAEAFGSATNRGTDLMRDALIDVDAISHGLSSTDDSLKGRWENTKRLIERLAQSYRID